MMGERGGIDNSPRAFQQSERKNPLLNEALKRGIGLRAQSLGFIIVNFG